MFRLLLAFGSFLLEMAMMISEGMLTVWLMLAGTILTASHLAIESSAFHRIVNHMTGFDLPESVEPVPELVQDRETQ